MQARQFPLTALRQWPTLPAILLSSPMNGVPILRHFVVLDSLQLRLDAGLNLQPGPA